MISYHNAVLGLEYFGGNYKTEGSSGGHWRGEFEELEREVSLAEKVSLRGVYGELEKR